MIAFLATILLLAQTVEPDIRKEAGAVFSSAKIVPAAHRLSGVYAEAVYIDEFAHVAITDDSKIAFERYGNGGLVEANVGTIKLDGINLDIEWQYPERHPNRPTVEKRLLLVPWGEARILVPRSRVHRFCINARENPKLIFDWYFVRKPIDLKELVGRPTIPEDYRALTDLAEIVASATSIEEQTFADAGDSTKLAAQAITLNKGAVDHVLLGMELECEKTARKYMVTSIDNHTCVAKSELTVQTKAAARPARRGWIFRTTSN